METIQDSSQKTSTRPSRSKAGKGWMICAIVLAVVLVAGGAFAAMIIAKGNRDTNRLSEVEAQLKDKETKIEELEKQIGKTPSGAAEDDISVDITLAKEKIAASENLKAENIELHDTIIATREDQKIILLDATLGIVGGSAYRVIYYKENSPGSEWKKVRSFHQMYCSDLTTEEIAIMKDLVRCINEDGDTEPVGAN